jgi:hypothetical protein
MWQNSGQKGKGQNLYMYGKKNKKKNKKVLWIFCQSVVLA